MKNLPPGDIRLRPSDIALKMSAVEDCDEGFLLMQSSVILNSCLCQPGFEFFDNQGPTSAAIYSSPVTSSIPR